MTILFATIGAGTPHAFHKGMRILDWMKSPVRTIKSSDTIRHARELMEKHRINQLPVVVDGGLVGIVTDRDLRDASPSVFAEREERAAFDAQEITVETVMSANVLTVGPEDDVITAALLMRRERVGALPVVDAAKLVGIVTRSDVLDALVDLKPHLPASRAPQAR